MDSDHAPLVTAVEVLAQEKRLRLRYMLTILALLCLLFITATIGISIGAVNISFPEVWTVIGLHILQHPLLPLRWGAWTSSSGKYERLELCLERW